MPIDDKLKWLLKDGGGHIFERCRKYAHLTCIHSCSLALFMYASNDSAMAFCHTLAYAVTANGVCLHLLVLIYFTILLLAT